MDSRITFIGLGIGLLALALRKIGGATKLASRLTVSTKVGKPGLKGGILGYLNIPVEVIFQNRAESSVKVRIASVKAIYKGKELGDIRPVNKLVEIAPYATTSYGNVNFELGIPYLFTSGITKDLLMSPNGPADVAKQLNIKIQYEVDGIAVAYDMSAASAVAGLGLTAMSVRKIRPKSDYAHLIAPDSSLAYADKVVNPDGDVDQTVALMYKIIKSFGSDTKRLAASLVGRTLDETCRNIWTFVYTHIQYERDSDLFEQLRRPLRTLHDQKGDCDCMAILCASMLQSLKIPFVIRITAYYNRPNFQHVYIIVPTSTGHITIDPVVDAYNYEKPYTKHKDFKA